MARKRYTTEQIIGLLREAEVRLGQGQAIGTICRGRPGQRSLPQSWGTKHRPEDGGRPAAYLGGAAEAMGGMAGRTRLHPMTRAALAGKFAEARVPAGTRFAGPDPLITAGLPIDFVKNPET